MEPSSRPRVSLRGMHRAASSLQDFVASYFMFHGLDATNPADVFAHLPTLYFVEARIYELDDVNEAASRADDATAGGAEASDAKMEDAKDAAVGRLRDVMDRINAAVDADERVGGASASLVRELDDFLGEGFASPALLEHLAEGETYWRVERALGGIDVKKMKEDLAAAPAYGWVREFLEDHVVDALRRKSFDYRAMNEVLRRSAALADEKARTAAAEEWRLRGGAVERGGRDEVEATGEATTGDSAAASTTGGGGGTLATSEKNVAEFLAASEFLVEIADDLYDYEEDVASGAFNFYRWMVVIHGPEGAAAATARIIEAAETTYARLEKTLDPALALRYRERCRRATREGAVGAIDDANPMGKWTIPAAIVDEDAFRSRVGGGE